MGNTVALAIHAGIIILVVVAATVLTLQGKLSADATLGIFGAALGYAGGSASTRAGAQLAASDPRGPSA